MKKCAIVVPTHSSYLDICKNFFELIEKNWKDCQYQKILSVIGEDQNPEICEYIYNGKNVTLPGCIYNASKKYQADYYLCFLGDAFVSKPVNSQIINEIIDYMEENGINYCSLNPAVACTREKKINQLLRYINLKDRYGFTFTAFIATKEFIDREFSNGETDFEFENKYLEISNSCSRDDDYYKDAVTLRQNYLNIYPAIVKGKWDRHMYNVITKDNPEIKLSDREKLGTGMMGYIFISRNIVPRIPNRLRQGIKKIIVGFKKDLSETK